jgi:hypothetical protein
MTNNRLTQGVNFEFLKIIPIGHYAANDMNTDAKEDKNWIGRWLQPTGHRAVISGLVILGLIVMVCLLVRETGGTGFAWLHLMYLPIILAAACFGIYGGIVAALVGGLALGPYMPMDVFQGLPQTTSNWMFRIVFFLLVGAFSGSI